MGQYWKACNIDKEECINAWELDGGAKAWEQLVNNDVSSAVMYLCIAQPERRGGGDLQSGPNIGRWAGDRIVWLGDYAEQGDIKAVNPTANLADGFNDTLPYAEYTDITEIIKGEWLLAQN